MKWYKAYRCKECGITNKPVKFKESMAVKRASKPIFEYSYTWGKVSCNRCHGMHIIEDPIQTKKYWKWMSIVLIPVVMLFIITLSIMLPRIF